MLFREYVGIELTNSLVTASKSWGRSKSFTLKPWLRWIQKVVFKDSAVGGKV